MKRILAVFLTLAMALNIAPMAAFAAADSDAASIVAVEETDETSSPQLDEETARAIVSDPFLQAAYAQTEQEQTGQAEVDTSNMSVSATNSFGQLLVNGIEGQSTDADGSKNRITNVTMNGRTANVQYVLDGTADLMVTIYTDSTEEELVASGTTEVSGSADNGAAQVSIVGDIPETYTIKAFLLDKTDHSPLSSAYTDVSHTQVMVDLDKATVDDFAEDRTINLDTDKNTNFAVVKQDVALVKQEDAAGKNTILEQDDDGLNYTIANASAEIKNLQVGDILTYEYAEGELLVVRVEDITKEGDTVKIHGDDTLELTDVFDAVKIESEESGEGMTYDGTDADADVTYTGMMEGDLEEGIDFEEAEDEENGDPEVVTKKIGFTFSISTDTFGNKTDTGTDKDKEDTGYVEKAKATGTYRFSGDIKVKWYLVDDEQMASITTEFEQVFTLEVTDAITRDIRLGRLGGRPIPGVFIGVEPTLKFKAEAKGSFAVSRKESATEEYSSRNNYVTHTNTDPEIKVSAKLEGSLYLGVDLGPTVRIGGKLIVAKVVLEGGVKGTATVADWADTTGETKHACNVCFQISVKGELKCGASFTFLYGIGKFEKMAAEISIPVWEGYWSATHKKLGIGSCPYKAYRVLIGVSGKAEAGIQIAQGTMAEYQAGTAQVLGVTGTTGLYPIYLEPGRYTITAIVNGQPYGQSTFNVEKAARTVLIDAGISAEPDTGTGGTDNPDKPDNPDPDPTPPSETIVASGACGKSLNWILSEDGTLRITGTGYMDAKPTWPKEQIVKVVVGKGVNNISVKAFKDCTNLTTISLPETLRGIESYAFYGCSNLDGVALPSSLTAIYTGAFAECTALTSVAIPSGVKTVDMETFKNCKSLTEVSIQGKVTEIGTDAFMNCTNLESISLPSSLKTLGDCAFQNCKSLKSVTIPNGVTSIAYRTFMGCSSLTEVSIQGKVTEIDWGAFMSCTNLESILLPSSLKTLGDHAFENCKSLKSVTIPNGVTSIGDYAFMDCSSLTEVSIQGKVTEIGRGAFEDCTNLESILLPSSLKTLGDCAFQNCKSLKSVTIPNGVTSIAYRTFMGCSSLTEVSIQGKVTEIGASAFTDCTNLESISLPESVIKIGNYAFKSTALTGKFVIPSGVTKIGDGLFENCQKLTEVVIPDGITFIGPYAFKYTGITSFVIPDGIRTINVDTFYGTCLDRITIPVSVTAINPSAFGNEYVNGYVKEVHYTGTKSDWSRIWVGGANERLREATIHCTDGDIVPNTENSITTGTASTSGSKFQATFADAKAGKEYVVLVSRSGSDPLNADNLIYINQITADADGELAVPFITAADAAEMTYVVACAQDDATVDPGQPDKPNQPDQPDKPGGDQPSSGGDGGGAAIILIGGVAAVAAVAGVALMMPVKVEGTVKLADQPVANATVQVLKNGNVAAQTTTDANGHFTVKVKRGGYTLRVQWTDASGQPVTRTVDFKAPDANLNVAA